MRARDVNLIFRRDCSTTPRDITIFNSDKTPIYLYDAMLIPSDIRGEEVLGCEFSVPIYRTEPDDSPVPTMRIGLDLAYAIVWEDKADKWFDEYGHFLAYLPEACIQECSEAGDVKPAVSGWRELLRFEVPRDKAVDYLREFGAWTESELLGMTGEELSERCLWAACGDIVEGRHTDENPDEVVNWVGLIH